MGKWTVRGAGVHTLKVCGPTPGSTGFPVLRGLLERDDHPDLDRAGPTSGTVGERGEEEGVFGRKVDTL